MNEFKIKKGLIVQGSGSLFPILDIQGSQGELFSVTDSLSGSLSSVNDISGLPILEVFSDDTVKMGTYNAEGLIVSGSTIKVGRLSTNVHTVTGSLNISGSVNVVNGVINNLTASFAVSASRAVSSSIATNVAYSGLTGTVPTWNQSTTGNAATATVAGGIRGPGGSAIISTTSGTSYSNHIQVREAEGGTNNGSAIYAPALGFHWGGLVASNIIMESNGRIAITDNPGTGYENFVAKIVYGGTSVQTQALYDLNNTGYYLDPASTSKLNTVIAEYYQSSGSTSPSFEVNRGAGSRYLFGSNVSITGSGIFDITAGLWRLVVKDTTGYVGIKTENPGYDLDVNGTVRAATSVTAPIYYDSDSTAYYVNPASTSVLNTLQVGVSITAPIYYDPNNASYYLDLAQTGDSIRVAGDIVAYYSDERLKDIKGNIENPLEKVLSLNGFYYEPNEKAQQLGYIKKMEVGVSAQEVEAVMPEIVKDAPIGHGYKTLNYAKLVPLLIEAIKEQQTQIEEIKRNCKCYE